MYRVLVVDDEEMITDSLAGMLEETPQYELDVYKAYSGTEALRLLNEFQLLFSRRVMMIFIMHSRQSGKG